MLFTIECKNLACHYDKNVVIDDLSLGVSQGEIFGLLGPNGAGKTTFLSMLAGIKSPSKGSIFISGINRSTGGDEIKKILGYVPQSLAFYPTLTALENLQFFCGIYQIHGKAAKNRIHEVLEVVGLSDRANDIAEVYSGGMKRRLNIAIGLLHNPKVLLLDEPTVGVDPHSRYSIFECIKKLARQGVTIVYTTHYMEEIERLCNRVAIIDGGKLIALDTPHNLCLSVGGSVFHLNIQGENKHSLIEFLSSLESVLKVNLRESRLEIKANDSKKTFKSILEASDRFNIEISNLHVSNSSLETVFLELTGRGLRD